MITDCTEAIILRNFFQIHLLTT